MLVELISNPDYVLVVPVKNLLRDYFIRNMRVELRVAAA